MTIKLSCIVGTVILLALPLQKASSQSLFDIGVGASTLDKYFTNFAYRHQVNDNFRAGFEIQMASPGYRFVEAIPFEKGYATSLSIPISIKITEQGKIRLDGYVRPGMRFQGVIDPDDNGIEDSTLKSRAVLFDAGLVVNVQLSEKLNLNSGVILPAGFEVKPTVLFEYLGTPNVTGGLSYMASRKTILFIKAISGPAFGADGDTYKYIWSVQGGIRLAFGKNPNNKSMFLEPSF
jgi:hypothetical protein